MSELPTGTVTFLFTDVEGSTRLLQELGAEDYAAALVEHRRVLREACADNGGIEVDTQGDAFFFAFATAPAPSQPRARPRTISERGPIRVRAGLHTGTPLLTEEGYVGEDVHRAARIAARATAARSSSPRRRAALYDGDSLVDLGEHRFKDLSAPERVLPARRRLLPSVPKPLSNEPPHAGIPLPRPGAASWQRS